MPLDLPRIALAALHGCEIFIRLFAPVQNDGGKSLWNRRKFTLYYGMAIAFQRLAKETETAVEMTRWPTQMKSITRPRRPWEING
jgi:hypothetical protein